MKNTLKKMFSVLLVTHEHTSARRMAASLALTLGLALGAQAQYEEENVPPGTEEEKTQEPVAYRAPVYKDIGGIVSPTNGIAEWKELSTNLYTVVESATETAQWSAGWYVVTNDVTLSAGAICDGAVHLILADGAKLTANADASCESTSITVSGDGNSLTIYGQKAGTGQLIATGVAGRAGIGGINNGAGVNITINGGTVTAQGGTDGIYGAAGIGGACQGGGGQNIVINGGTVTAKGGKDAAGIGGGCQGGGGQNIVINGGTVTAKGDGSGAGIGGGQQGEGENIVINGGKVKATAGQDCSNAIGDGAI